MDPFDQSNPATGSNPYQNLMNFGAATMANSAGAGAVTGATSIGKGILTAQDIANKNTETRSDAGYRNSETTKNNFGNQMSLMGLNAMRQHYGQSPLQIGPNGQLAPAPQIADQQIAAVQQQAQNQPQQSQGMTGQSWSATPGSSRLNGTPQTNSYPAGSSGTPGDPYAVPPGANQQLWNQGVSSQYTNPELSKQLFAASMTGANAEAEASARARHPGIIEARQGGEAYAPEAGITVTGRLEGETTSGARYLTPPGISGPGIPKPATQPSAPTAGGNFSPQQASVEDAMPEATRAVMPVGGKKAPASAAGIQIDAPPPMQTALADTGSGSPAYGAEPTKAAGEPNWPVKVESPASPFGIKPGETLEKIPPYVEKWQEVNLPKMENLQTQMQQQVAIDDSIIHLKNASMLQPGPWANERKEIVDSVNTLARSYGAPNLMSEASGADAAEFVKSAQQATNTAAHEISSKGTNFDIVSAAKANPQYSMPYMSALITNSMNSEAAARNYNRISYINTRMTEGVPEAQATQEFERQQPGDLVVKRAESVVTPIKANKLNINKLLPGTKVVGPNGQIGYIPIPSDYPFMVPYTNPLVKSQRGAQ